MLSGLVITLIFLKTTFCSAHWQLLKVINENCSSTRSNRSLVLCENLQQPTTVPLFLVSQLSRLSLRHSSNWFSYSWAFNWPYFSHKHSIHLVRLAITFPSLLFTISIIHILDLFSMEKIMSYIQSS
jgi:hypothetical protein